MSVKTKDKPITVKYIQKQRELGEKITMLTAYDYSTAKILDEAGTDILLVGDSLGMTILGYDNTLNVTMDEMLVFTKAVARGAKRSFVMADMPFLSYHVSKEKAIENAGMLIQAGAQAVKLEGASDFIIDIVKHLSEIGIAVMAHIGFTPQYINSIGGYYVQGKSYENALKMAEDAKKLEEAGAFAILVEMIPEETAKYLRENISVPLIGIGAGRYCDGQVLVIDDIIGKYADFTPKFAKKYTNIKETILNTAENYIYEVKNGKFPDEEHIFKLSPEESEKLELYINK